jgi:hypothetical protein
VLFFWGERFRRMFEACLHRRYFFEYVFCNTSKAAQMHLDLLEH